MYALASRDMELACDEAALRGGADRERYALALLRMEEQRWSPSASHFSGHALEERIRAIMKRKQFSTAALAALLVVMSITTTVFASAAPAEKEQTGSRVQTGLVRITDRMQEADVSVISRDGEDGGTLFSTDGGKTWMDEDRYHAGYGGDWGGEWQVEWWTYEAYKAWLDAEKEALESIIDERSWTPSTGWFVWDQEKVDETVAMYEEILEKIKNGALYSKTIVDKSGNMIEDVMLGSDRPYMEAVLQREEDMPFVYIVDNTALRDPGAGEDLTAGPVLVRKGALGFDACTPVTVGIVTAGFGQGRRQFHSGVDVSAERGTDIAAFAAGTVSETGFSAEQGNYLVLAHAGGYSTLYAHCQNIAVAAGESVTMGQKIAEVGATGMVTGPALHFELRSGETCLDPGAYLDLST